jgi:hypothetical protein
MKPLTGRWVTALSCCLLFVAFLVCVVSSEEQGSPTLSAVKPITEHIKGMQDWSIIGDNDKLELCGSEYLASLRSISKYDNATIRAAFVALAENSEDDFSLTAKMYVLTKGLFQVPERVPSDEKHEELIGNWLGVPSDDRGVDGCWPWATDKDGSLRLKAKFAGYRGPDIDPVKVFDFCAKTYLRRRFDK